MTKCVLALGMMALVPAAVTAQQRAEITPFVASYYGLTHLAEGSAGPFSGNKFTVDQDNAFALGGRVTVPIGGRLSLEGEFTYSLSGASITEKNGVAAGTDGGISQKGNMIFGSLRAVVSPRRSNLFLLAGPAIITRGGDAWDGVKKSDITDFGGVVGFGFRANVTPRFRVNFTLESYLYSFNGGGDKSKFQSDLLASLGVPISLGH
ncbi:MAG TPA: outer membrane beta-barrel protein [Gemmatimonadales bacterium]|nr:outer membrane beta-barrel protein [Gemmatimonadales bacterium]